jgi:hypothetical protein
MIAGFEAFDGWDATSLRDIGYNNAARLFPRLARAVEQGSAGKAAAAS